MMKEMQKEYRVTTWGSAAFDLGLEYLPTKPPLKGNTLRQVAHISPGGDKFNDYPSVLAGLFQTDSATADLAVVNSGIGGNKFAENSCEGPCGLDRFERDVLSIDGVRYALVFIGTNDVGAANEGTVQSMIAGYEKIAVDCHERDIKVYAATITPLKKSGYDTDFNRQVLAELNDYLKSDESVFDGVVDFYAAVDDEENPGTVAKEYNCPWGDYLHLGAKGYEKLAETAFVFFKDIK